MKIEFFKIDTGEVLKDTDDTFFVMNNSVWCDNFVTYESQYSVIGFEDCVKERKDIGWRVI